MVLPVLAIYGMDKEGATPAMLGLALGIYGLTQAVFQIPLGLLSDFIGRKPVILFGLCVFFVGCVIAANADSVWGLVVGRALQGSGAIASTVMALVADLTSEKNRTKAMAAIGASIGLSFTLAMILGPLLASAGGLSAVFYLAALLSVLGVLITLFWVPTAIRSGRSHRDSGAIPSLILQTLKRPELARLNFGIFILHMVLTAMFVAVPVLLVERAGIVSESHWMVYLPVLLVSFIFALPVIIMAEKKRRSKEAFLGAIVVIFLSFSGMLIEQSRVFIGSLFLFFLAFNLLEAMLPSLVSKLSPAGSKGTAMGLYSSSQFFGAFIGGAGGGLVLLHYGTAMLFGACMGVTAVWIFVAVFMRAPQPLSSVCYSVMSSAADVDVLVILGVADAIYVPEDGILYLKVDKKTLDHDALNELLAAHLADTATNKFAAAV